MEKRLFIGLSVEAPWPTTYPKGRVLEENARHITLAFLGREKMPNLESFPKPPFLLGPAACTKCTVFLPKLKPRVVAYQIDWVSGENSVFSYRQALYSWLESQGYRLDQRPFHPHMTIARAPFFESHWEDHFQPLPLLITGVHLYESIGNLCYKSVFFIPFVPVFAELEHTADLAFHIRGKNNQDLYSHAALALSYEFPFLMHYRKESHVKRLDEAIKLLNQMISACDRDYGCPFKAVSYHGKVEKEAKWMKWEMVVDV